MVNQSLHEVLLGPSETQRTHDASIKALEKLTNWERVFCEVDNIYAKGKPGKSTRTYEDMREFKQASDKLETNPDGFTIYRFHSHENGDHLPHTLDIEFHPTGFQELRDKGVLY